MKAIYQIMEDKYFEVKEVDVETEYLNVNETESEAKFIFSNDCVNYLIGNNSNICDIFKSTFNSELKFITDKNNQLIEKDETIIVSFNITLKSVKGTVNSIHDSICLIIKNVQPFIKETYKGKDSFSIKMFIPKIYVTKLIGAKGSMIQEIANTSGGATIKILSDKRLEKKLDLPDIILSIAGSLGPMQDASCIIIEQLENFKNGGPVINH